MKKFQQIFAIFLIIILVGLYAATFITAIMASPSSHKLFIFSVVMTIAVPVLMYVLMMFSKLFKNSTIKHINEQMEHAGHNAHNMDDASKKSGKE